jgi:hypothetical protein
LTFFARTKEFLTAGSYLVSITNPADKNLASLARSRPLPQGTSEWQEYSVEFISPVSQAISIKLLQENGATARYSAFGHVWLDNFSLANLDSE